MRKRSEEELLKTIETLENEIKELEKENKERRFTELLFNITGKMARVGGWEVDVEKEKVYWTRTTRMIHEVDDNFEPNLEEAINFFPEESKEIIQKAVQEAIEKGKNYDVTVEFETAKRSRLWVRTIGRSVFDEGKCVRLYGTFQDVTAQKVKEDELREALTKSKRSEQEISELLNATYAILSSGDFNKVARKIFDACARVIGAKAGYVALLSEDGKENELLFLEDGGMPCTVDPNLPMPIRGLRAEAYESGRVVFDNEFMKSKWVKYMPKGHMGLENVLFAPLNIEGKTVGIMGLAIKEGGFNEHDTRLAEAFGEYAAIALQNSKYINMMKKNIKEKEILIREIHHRIKNNMQVISAMLQLQAAEIGDDKLTAILEEAQARVDSMSRVHQMMYRTKDLEHIDMKKYLEELIHSLKALYPLDSSDITIISDSKDVFLNLNQSIPAGLIINELISNAVKHAFPKNKGGTITVHLEKNKDQVMIQVSDDGIGLPDNFDIHSVESMGLEIVNLLTDQLKGSVKVASSNKGTQFSITFPLTD